MRHCEPCHVDLPDNPRRCPLCNAETAGEGGEHRVIAPLPTEQAAQRGMIRLLAFGSVSSAAICLGINLILRERGWWVLFVLLGIAIFWISFGVLFKKRGNLPKGVLWQVVILSVTATLWDVFSGFRGWSVDYVLPLLFISTMVSMPLIGRLQNRRLGEYLHYWFLSCLIGLIPLIFILTGILHQAVPSTICFIGAIVCLAYLVFYHGKTLWSELQRRYHV